MNNKILAGIIVGIVIVGATTFYFTLNTMQHEKLPPLKLENNTLKEEKLPVKPEEKEGLVKFASYDEIQEFLKD